MSEEEGDNWNEIFDRLAVKDGVDDGQIEGQALVKWLSAMNLEDRMAFEKQIPLDHHQLQRLVKQVNHVLLRINVCKLIMKHFRLIKTMTDLSTKMSFKICFRTRYESWIKGNKVMFISISKLWPMLRSTPGAHHHGSFCP